MHKLHISLLTCSTSCPLITSTSVRVSRQNLVCETSLSNLVWEAVKGLRFETWNLYHDGVTQHNCFFSSSLCTEMRLHLLHCLQRIDVIGSLSQSISPGGFVSVRRKLSVSRSTWRRAGGPKIRTTKIGTTPLRVCYSLWYANQQFCCR